MSKRWLSSNGHSNGSLDNVLPPYVGQIFKTYEDAKDYYFLYALRIGFFVRKGTTKVVNGRLILRRFVCHKEGFARCSGSNKGNYVKKLMMSREMRCRCDVSLRIKRISYSDRWIVGSMNDSHSHAMVTLSRHRYLRTNRAILT